MQTLALDLDPLIRGLRTVKLLQNPLHILFKRMFGAPTDIMTVVDRETGVRCQCTVGSYHMFASSWYSRDYDVPCVSLRDGDVVLDIGANQGFFTCYAARKGAKVYAFEPNPENYDRLVHNVKQNGLEELVTVKPWAISDEEGFVKLMVSEELGGGRSTIVPKFAENSGISIRKNVTVPCYTVPQILQRFAVKRVRLCKIDAEGAEFQILSPLDSDDRRCIDSLVMEYHPEAYALSDLIKLLLSWGTHQVSFMDEKPYTGNVLRAVSNTLLLNET
jgi:FkbM family methyltransferase